MPNTVKTFFKMLANRDRYHGLASGVFAPVFVGAVAIVSTRFFELGGA